MDVRFGPWARLASFQIESMKVQPLPNAQQILDDLRASTGYSGGWIYPPLRKPLFDDRTTAPLIPVQAYGLPPTHSLVLDAPYENEDLADFLIALLGFTDGVRLTREGWSHFYKAPLELHSLCDFVPGLREIAEIVRVGSALWMNSAPGVRGRLFGAIHWLQFSSLREHDFERFGGSYSVLDTIYWIHREWTNGPKVPHAQRAAHLADFYHLPIPNWAAVAPNGTCRVADLRNELVHEARYAGAPTGFSYPKDHPLIAMELGDFVSRLLFAIFRIPCGYTSTPVTTRQIHGLDVMGPLQAV